MKQNDMKRPNLFTKMVLLIFLLLIPILVLYSYSNYVSQKVVRDEIQDSSLNHLSYFLDQIEENVDQLTWNSIIMSRDPNVLELLNTIDFIDPSLDLLNLKATVRGKLELQSISSSWDSHMSVYLPDSNLIISNPSAIDYNHEYFEQHVTEGWDYRNLGVESDLNSDQYFFVHYTADPFHAYDEIENARSIIEIRFSNDNVINMLDQFKENNENDAFFYHSEYDPILNRTANQEKIAELIHYLNGKKLEDIGSSTIELGDEEYLVNYIQSDVLGWHLIDYVPLEEAMSPITLSRNLFYISVGMLLVLSILTSFLLYRYVQVPIRKLIYGVQRIKRGDYSVRLERLPKNEFNFLFTSFNAMAEQIQDLIEKVYEEKLRSRDATLKQLQSQINPHFLYNSLFYIKNMARLKNEEAVVEMSLNLAQYYRYATRLEKTMATVAEEIEVIDNYLQIQNLRMQRIDYDIDIPEEILSLHIPRISLQPIVENAIEHGIEPKVEGGYLLIRGEQNQTENRIIVEDDGIGISDDELRKLNKQLTLPLQENMGYGMWNVHQRMQYKFGKGAGISLLRSDAGGVKVILFWPKIKDQT